MKNILFIMIWVIWVDLADAQNVGIGTTTPTAKLDIIGSIKITDGTQGADKVLTSDGSGRASWKNAVTSSSSVGIDSAVISIGCSVWSTKNLDVTTYRDGTPIPLVTDAAIWANLTTGAYCYFGNSAGAYGTVYGKLYNWYAVNNPKGLAPAGWHIPSDFEWTTLINTLGGTNSAGGPMKSIGTSYWSAPNLGATNICNFNALPGGQRNAAGQFTGVNLYGNWWSSSKNESNQAWSRNLNNNDTHINGANSDLRCGYAVRCIKD